TAYFGLDWLAIDPTTPTIMYRGATNGFGVLRSMDGGQTWSDFSAGLTSPDIIAVTIDPTLPTHLYAGARGGGVVVIDQVAVCPGDCDSSGAVTVGDLLTMVNIALARADVGLCRPGDINADRVITVSEILTGVNSLLNPGCVAAIP